jgi:phytol kinase
MLTALLYVPPSLRPWLGIAVILGASRLLLYTIPLSLVVYADAAAALIGSRYGTWHFPTTGARKSVEGSAAFVVMAFFTTHVPLLLAGRVSAAASLLIAILIAVFSAAIEVLCWNGLDNVAVPLIAFAILRMLK